LKPQSRQRFKYFFHNGSWITHAKFALSIAKASKSRVNSVRFDLAFQPKTDGSKQVCERFLSFFVWTKSKNIEQNQRLKKILSIVTIAGKLATQ